MKHAIWALACLPAVAHAADLACGPAEKGAVVLDGLTDDWKDVDGIDAGGRDANLSFTLKCNVDAQTLWLLVDVRDNYFVRTPKAKPGEDHLTLTLGGRRYVVFPGDAAAIQDKAPKGIRTASALQAQGWAVELAVPLRMVGGFRPGLPQIAYTAAVADSDSKAALKTERVVDSSGGILFAGGEDALAGFLKDRGLAKKDVFWERNLVLGRASGARAVMAGRFLAFISDEYLFLELPFQGRKDLLEARAIDLAGDGRQAVVMRYLERGGGAGGPISSVGSREVLAVYRPGGARVERVFAAEVGKTRGTSALSSKVSFVRRGKATDVVIEAGEARGFDPASYKESPADDMVPILLPWGDDKRARYQFRGDEYLRQ